MSHSAHDASSVFDGRQLCYDEQSMADISEELARRDRFLRARRMQMTPEQRMAQMQRMQAAAWTVLKNSPNGYAHFMARNFKARAVDVDINVT
jgi:hypothetical protein